MLCTKSVGCDVTPDHLNHWMLVKGLVWLKRLFWTALIQHYILLPSHLYPLWVHISLTVHALPHTPQHIPSLYIPSEGFMCSWYSVCTESNRLWWALNRVATTIFLVCLAHRQTMLYLGLKPIPLWQIGRQLESFLLTRWVIDSYISNRYLLTQLWRSNRPHIVHTWRVRNYCMETISFQLLTCALSCSTIWILNNNHRQLLLDGWWVGRVGMLSKAFEPTLPV